MYELTIKCFLYELWGIAIVIIDEHAYAGYSFFSAMIATVILL